MVFKCPKYGSIEGSFIYMFFNYVEIMDYRWKIQRHSLPVCSESWPRHSTSWAWNSLRRPTSQKRYYWCFDLRLCVWFQGSSWFEKLNGRLWYRPGNCVIFIIPIGAGGGERGGRSGAVRRSRWTLRHHMDMVLHFLVRHWLCPLFYAVSSPPPLFFLGVCCRISFVGIG